MISFDIPLILKQLLITLIHDIFFLFVLFVISTKQFYPSSETYNQGRFGEVCTKTHFIPLNNLARIDVRDKRVTVDSFDLDF